MSQPEQTADAEVRSGVILGLLAYTMWGVFPVYFKWIESVAPTEVLVHRVVWAVPFGAVIIMARRQWREVLAAFVDRSMLFWLGLAALCISVNWLIYIWAVQNERIFEASLGYYINPLIYVAVGVMAFGERLRPLQITAVVLALIGVSYLTISGGIFRGWRCPWPRCLRSMVLSAGRLRLVQCRACLSRPRCYFRSHSPGCCSWFPGTRPLLPRAIPVCRCY